MSRWSSFADFIRAVRRSADGPRDPRLPIPPQAAAPTTQSQEGSGAEGGYLVPPDLRTEVVTPILADDSLLGLTDLQRATSNSLTVPGDIQPPWSSSGPQVVMEPEGAVLARSKLRVVASTLRLLKAQVTLPVTDEMLEDAAGLSAYLRQVVPARFIQKFSDLIVNNDGTSGFIGLLTADEKVVQAKEGAQATGTIVLLNTQRMYQRMATGSLRRAVWLAHPEAANQLQALGLPHYVNEEGGPTLHGRPILYTEVCQPLSTEGDLIFWDPKGYLTALRAYEAGANDIRQDTSLYCWWDLGISAVRFYMRVAGQPWVGAPWVRMKTSTTVSHIVTLQTR